MTYEFLKSLYVDVLSMISEIVVKRNDLAREAETVDSIRAFEIYLACVNGSRYFYTFPAFDEDILAKYIPKSEMYICMKDRNRIPEEFRDQIVKEQADRVVANYVETNEYYRMLMGLPPVNDHYWIYVDGQEDVPPDVPIHKLSVEQITQLEIRGVLADIKKAYPNAAYLDYLGVNSIDLIDARLAKPFEILRLGPSSSPMVQEMFEKEYYGARQYILGTIYNRNRFTNKKLYDPTIGVLMLTLAVRNTLVPDEAAYLSFEEILDAILESYGFLQYFKRFPFTYKRRLVLALDNLLMVKGTDGVLVDVCKLFSPDDLIANRYYLMKTHAKDADGNIIFSDDPETAYQLNFVRASISEHDINTTEENRLSYDSVVDNDYLWQLTKEEKEEMMKLDFNLMMTKYVDVEAAYEITSLIFEVCCFLNLLLHARENIAKIQVVNTYATRGKCSLFAMINFLLDAMAKRANFDGNIVYEPEPMCDIWGFNYRDIEDQIQEIVDKYELQVDVDTVLLEGFKMELDEPKGISTPMKLLITYAKNRELFDAITKEMAVTTDIRQYIALSNCRDLFYTSAMEEASFLKRDGSHANTYHEMLQDIEPKLAKKVEDTNGDDDLNALIVYILERLEDMFNQANILQYLFLNTPTVYATLIGKYIRIAINVFKASSVQLRSINAFFYLGDRDPIRVIDDTTVHVEMGIDDWIHVDDELSTAKTIFLDDYIAVGDKVYVNQDYEDEV